MSNDTDTKNEYEIQDPDTKRVLFTASPELYREIVTQTLMSGRYTHTFEIFREPALTVTFRTVSEGERQALIHDLNKMLDESGSAFENSAKGNMMALVRHMLRLNVGGADIPVTSDDPKNSQAVMDRMKNMPSNVMEKLVKYQNVFLQLVARAFDSDDLLKN